MHVNQIRGETVLLMDGKPQVLCLTLGALAEIETALGMSDLSDLSVRLEKISANDVVLLLAALLKGGGNAMSIAQIQAARTDPAEVAKAIAKAFSLAGSDE